jgi:hypothetical protein
MLPLLAHKRRVSAPSAQTLRLLAADQRCNGDDDHRSSLHHHARPGIQGAAHRAALRLQRAQSAGQHARRLRVLLSYRLVPA